LPIGTPLNFKRDCAPSCAAPRPICRAPISKKAPALLHPCDQAELFSINRFKSLVINQKTAFNLIAKPIAAYFPIDYGGVIYRD
jgi:hypothetical protein